MSSANGHKYAFDGFVVDPVNRELTRDGLAIPLQGKVFDVLLALTENPNRLLTKNELIDKVWDADFVEEGNLARHISTLRKALGDNGKDHKYIATVQGRGYRFLPEVSKESPAEFEPATPAVAAQEAHVETSGNGSASKVSFRWILFTVTGLTLLTAAWFGSEGLLRPANQIKTLAVLPLKRIDGGDNYLGIGIADAVIRKISQAKHLMVRPTSAILRYVNTDTDAIAAAREMNTDAVLEGNVQSSGDRLRVSVNLLRTIDGSSIWADTFELPTADAFLIQDKVSERVATRLQLHVDSMGKTAPNGGRPTDPAAYQFYVRGIYSLDQRGSGEDALPQMLNTVDCFKKAIEIDPNYALAHAQLAWAYAWTAQTIQPGEPKWVDMAMAEISRADQLDPNIAETHLARAMVLWSAAEGYQSAAAIREARLANEIDPNAGHGELAGIYGHMGLEKQASTELDRALEIDPTSASFKELTILLPFFRGDPDAEYAEVLKQVPGTPPDELYLLRKGRLDEANKLIDDHLRAAPNSRGLRILHALLRSLMGDPAEARAKLPALISEIEPHNQTRHHSTYLAACAYALGGDTSDAVKMLRETANTGFPNYPLFARDPFLDRLRQTPEFIQFLAEQKAQWEKFQQEFSDQ